jgi:hypothetical protein
MEFKRLPQDTELLSRISLRHYCSINYNADLDRAIHSFL